MSRKGIEKTERKGSRAFALTLVAIGVGATLFVLARMPGGGDSASAHSSMRFTDVAAQTHEFHAYNRSVSLTKGQEAIMSRALSNLPAPCCSDKSAYTCCCECNMAKSWWGLSKHLIADEGYDADQVRAAVRDWFAFINPGGFSGDACYTGGCVRPFRQNGCGGMDESRLAL